MKSTKAWMTANKSWEGYGKSKKHGLVKRMIRLAGDWALLADPETKGKVKEFAADEDAFFDAFKAAWRKVISKTENTLHTCSGTVTNVALDVAADAMQCQDRHWKCPNARCWNAKWAGLCPRKCKTCPDQVQAEP